MQPRARRVPGHPPIQLNPGVPRFTQGMRASVWGVLLAFAGLLLANAAHAQSSGSWYYCDPAHAYYPYVRTCLVPWHQITPNPNPQYQTGPQQLPAASAKGGQAPPFEPSTDYMSGQTAPPIGDGHWYYCDATRAYYPFVKACSGPWRQVPASGPVPPAPPVPLWVQQRGAAFLKYWEDDKANIVWEYQRAIEESKQAAEEHKRQEEAMARERTRRDEDERTGYKYMSVSDLVLDKKILSPKTKLIIKGFYQPVGDVDWLVEYFRVPNTPKIGLLLDDAPRNVRATLQRCRLSHGCAVTLIGHVGECEHLFLGTAYETDQCLFVDGIR